MPRQHFEKDNPGALPISAYAKEPPYISKPGPGGLLLHNFDETSNDMQEPRTVITTRCTSISKQRRKEQPRHHLNGKYVTIPRAGQIGKVLKTYSDDNTDSALLKIFETTIDDPRVLTYKGHPIYLVIDIDDTRIDEEDEEIRLSEEKCSVFIIAWTGIKRDLDVDAGY